jgi:hypothetical protein
MRKVLVGIAASVALGYGLVSSTAQAGAIVGGSSLLTTSELAQLETYLGEGPLTITRIFEKQPGLAHSANFHAAADGAGRTFTVFEMTDDGVTRLMGGYNPLSWSTVGNSGSWNISGSSTLEMELASG